MKGYLVVYPAYGRSYPTADKAKEEFLNGKDFSASALGGPYLSIRDFHNKIPELSNFDGVVLTQRDRKFSATILNRTEMGEGNGK